MTVTSPDLTEGGGLAAFRHFCIHELLYRYLFAFLMLDFVESRLRRAID
jgi:hypothetical protein